VSNTNPDFDNVPKGIYRHYKGGEYRVFDIAIHSETEELLVVYKPLYKDQLGEQKLWVRPLNMFVEKIKIDGRLVARFQLVSIE